MKDSGLSAMSDDGGNNEINVCACSHQYLHVVKKYAKIIQKNIKRC